MVTLIYKELQTGLLDFEKELVERPDYLTFRSKMANVGFIQMAPRAVVFDSGEELNNALKSQLSMLKVASGSNVEQYQPLDASLLDDKCSLAELVNMTHAAAKHLATVKNADLRTYRASTNPDFRKLAVTGSKINDATAAKQRGYMSTWNKAFFAVSETRVENMYRQELISTKAAKHLRASIIGCFSSSEFIVNLNRKVPKGIACISPRDGFWFVDGVEPVDSLPPRPVKTPVVEDTAKDKYIAARASDASYMQAQIKSLVKTYGIKEKKAKPHMEKDVLATFNMAFAVRNSQT